MGIWFRVEALDPHLTFPTLAAARAAMHAAGVAGSVTRYRETPTGVVANTVH